jgi:energy-coupling factor transporter transmembrane protein EcfT
MTYFTILHWFALLFFFVLFLLLVFISKKERRKNIFWSMVFASFLVTATGAVFSMFVLDKYTKKGKLVHIENHRILRTEEIVFKGRVKNVGKFRIGKCKLSIKMINNPVESGKLSGGQLYKPSGMDFFKSKESRKERPNTILKEFVVARNLDPDEVQPFTVRMPYPPYFSKTRLIYHLYCH